MSSADLPKVTQLVSDSVRIHLHSIPLQTTTLTNQGHLIMS